MVSSPVKVILLKLFALKYLQLPRNFYKGRRSKSNT
jgi:hypothetical protein